MRLFSYCIPIDDGAAPNPYWGECTLTICKPVIRRVAKEGDWIVGLGGKDVLGTDYSGKVVYAMKVTRKLSLERYDQYCRDERPNKIPNILDDDYRCRVGDCIYDFESSETGILRPSVHNEDNRNTDLNGENALISDHFFYFGNNAINLPPDLSPIINQQQGHRSNSNEPYKHRFVEWIESLDYAKNSINGAPQIIVDFLLNTQDGEVSASVRCQSAINDEDSYEQNHYVK